ncbi:Abi family protein, partial [Blautia wexlerae]
ATTTTDYTYINYYRKTYGEIPLWVLANVLTFGNLSKMFLVFPQSLKSKVSKNFEPLNQHQMEQFLSVLTKYRNVCAHGERLFTYRTVDAIADTPLHKKLSLPQSGNQYEKGKQDLFAVVIAFRYKRKLIKEMANM